MTAAQRRVPSQTPKVAALLAAATLLVPLLTLSAACQPSVAVSGPQPPAGQDDGAVPDAGDAEVAVGGDIVTQPDVAAVACQKASGCKNVPETPYCNLIEERCVQCIVDFHCGGDAPACVDSLCTPITCTPGEAKCLSHSIRSVCVASGDNWDHAACPQATPRCAGGACRVCAPGQVYCAEGADAASQPERRSCSADGLSSTLLETCAKGTSCVDGACMVCVPGMKTCEGGVAMVCDADAAWTVANDCSAKSLQCLGRLCVDPCGGDVRANTYQGCDVHVPTLGGGQEQTLVILGATFTTKAILKDPKGSVLATAVIAPNDVATMTLGGQGADAIAVGAGLGGLRLVLNSANAVFAFTGAKGGSFASATRAHGEYALGKTLRVVGWPQSSAGAPTAVVVQLAGSGSYVEVTPKAALVTSAGAKLVPGVAVKVAAIDGAVVLQTDAVGADPTGTLVQCSAPCQAFVVQLDAYAPTTNRCLAGACVGQGWPCKADADCPKTCCGDHAVLVLPPTNEWPSYYWALPSPPRGKAKDIWRIVAHSDGTQVVLDPPLATVPVLAQGEHFDLESAEAFTLSSNVPVGLVHVLPGAFAPGPNNDVCVGLAPKSCATAKASDGAALLCAVDLDCPNLPEPFDAGIGGPELSWAEKTSGAVPVRGYCPASFAAHFVTVATST